MVDLVWREEKRTALVIARGNQYAVYIDGQPIAYTTHNELLDGAYVLIGIYSSPGYSEVDFDKSSSGT